MVTIGCLYLQVQGISAMPSPGLFRHCMQVVHRHTCRQDTHTRYIHHGIVFNGSPQVLESYIAYAELKLKENVAHNWLVLDLEQDVWSPSSAGPEVT